MSFLAMAWRYLRFRWLVSLLTVAGIALGVALVCAVLALRHESERALSRDAGLYDLVAGGKGSPLQLVLSSVYHLDSPTGNLPYSVYERMKRDSRILWAAPIGLGDNYSGYRIVGTESHFFDLPDRNGEPFFRFADGQEFKDRFEVVLGSQVASSSGLGVGDSFFGTHGLVEVPGAEVHRDFPYRVSGILAPTGTAQDRAIFGTLASVWEIHETEDRLHASIQGSALLEGRKEREATAILIRLKTPGLRLWMADEVRKETDGIAAVPINEILRFQRGIIGPVQRALLFVAAAVVAVSCLTVLVTLYQAAERRRRDIAILRSLGALRGEVASLVFAEGLLLTGGGILLGLLIGHGGLALSAGPFRDATGLVLDPWRMPSAELVALGIMGLCGSLSSFFPSISCYRRTPIDDLHLTD
ncbi:ABC transporter permease [Verrucomicrobia bacterium]|nr:ABC transporter permease [Verrucomicrobiota bacterium]